MISRPIHSVRRPAFITSRRVALAAVATLAAITLTPSASHADTSSTVTVVGTSDVFDSDLIQNVIKPDFEAATGHKYSLNYVSLGTGAAITYAEAGTASALLVHAASLENTFVTPPSGPTFSDEQYGRAIFYGDYVLLGPASDPAGVMTGGQPSHNMVDAFQKIAAAGEATPNPTAYFISRANTSGTAVQEHLIWADTTGVTNLCDVSSGTNGGGEVPSTATGPCPAGTVNSIPAPPWYVKTNQTQGPNIVTGDACNPPGDTGSNNCYVFTDRGTYQFLQSEGALSHLQVVADNNSASAPGGANLLINSFHAYALNPAAFTGMPNVHINLPGALAFLNWLTSPTGQAQISAYQKGDPGGPAFIGDAAPALTASALPATVKAGGTMTVSGSLSNVVPGTPPLFGVTITLSAKLAGASTAVAVATATTSASGQYTLHYKPTADATYTVSSPGISQIENATLSPQYGDLLQATSKSLGKSTVTGAAKITSATAKKGVVTIKGTLSPAVSGSGATLRVYAGHASAATQHFIVAKSLSNAAKTFTVKVKLARGFTWKVRVRYVNTGQIAAGSSAARSVHVT
jgi:tungstate transport system substrate-binding protein